MTLTEMELLAMLCINTNITRQKTLHKHDNTKIRAIKLKLRNNNCFQYLKFPSVDTCRHTGRREQ